MVFSHLDLKTAQNAAQTLLDAGSVAPTAAVAAAAAAAVTERSANAHGACYAAAGATKVTPYVV